jgi:hypothetical protein
VIERRVDAAPALAIDWYVGERERAVRREPLELRVDRGVRRVPECVPVNVQLVGT